MDKSFLEKITDKALKEQLGTIPLGLVAQAVEHYTHQMDVLVPKTNRDERIVQPGEWDEMFPVVRDQVNKFLETDVPLCEYGTGLKNGGSRFNAYFALQSALITAISIAEIAMQGGIQMPTELIRPVVNTAFLVFIGNQMRKRKETASYFRLFKSINLNTNNKYGLHEDMAHEFTHCIHHVKSIPTMSRFWGKKYNVFEEGHAVSVARHMGQQMYEETGDLGYTSEQLYFCRHALLEIGGDEVVHILLSSDQDERKKELSNTPIPKENIDICDRYELGTALFALHEMVNGPEIYAQVLRGEYDFPPLQTTN